MNSICIEWQGAVGKGGYGNMRVDGKYVNVHRQVYIDNNGPIEKGMVIRHKCHNRLCMNLEHLELGTHQQNMDDMVAAGRQKSSFTPEQREYVLSSDKPTRVLAEEIGCHMTTIQRLRKRAQQAGDEDV